MTPRQARAAGDHAAAIRAWHALLDQTPDDWRLALGLRQDLQAAGIYPDSDARFRRVAAHLPDQDWLDHYTSICTYHADTLEPLDARARDLLARSPHEVRLHVLRAEVARHRRDWAVAAGHLNAAAIVDPAAGHARDAAVARLYGTLAVRPWPDAGPGYAVLALNLDRNRDRWADLQRAFAASAIPLRRITGIEGARLPAPAVARLAGRADAPRGTLGCFLAHVAAWEALLASPDDCALIVEDDVIPLLDLPARLGGLGLPNDWDVVWVNDRMAPPSAPTDALSIHPLAAALAAFHAEHNAPGGDGYLISRAGARKLLDWVAADGMADDVDWRMVAYALSPEDVAAVPAHIVARRLYLDRLSPMVPRPDRLQAYALHPALIRTVGLESDREDENRLSC